MKILITGSSGLIGRWTVERLLKEGHQVVGLDLLPSITDAQHYEHRRGNILDSSYLSAVFEQTRPDAVIHLAARIDLDGLAVDDYPANIQGVRNVVAAIAGIPSVKRAIYTSSQLVCRVGHVPKTDTEYLPNTPYGESKVLTEKIVREMDGGGVEWVLCRPTTVWGPYMNEHYLRFLNFIKSGRYFHVGKGKLYKSYAYAGNIAWQYYRLLIAPGEAVHRKTFYLADYNPLSLREYANALQHEFGSKPIPTCPYALAWLGAKAGDMLALAGWNRFPFNSFRLRNIMTEYQFDLEHTRNVCGELPYTFEMGIDETAAWFKAVTADNAHL